jgi:hypothetical protein
MTLAKKMMRVKPRRALKDLLMKFLDKPKSPGPTHRQATYHGIKLVGVSNIRAISSEGPEPQSETARH